MLCDHIHGNIIIDKAWRVEWVFKVNDIITEQQYLEETVKNQNRENMLGNKKLNTTRPHFSSKRNAQYAIQFLLFIDFMLNSEIVPNDYV